MSVVGIGQCCWDMLALVETYPEVDEKEEIRFLTEQGGGPVATALVTLARLGNTCRFHGINCKTARCRQNNSILHRKGRVLLHN